MKKAVIQTGGKQYLVKEGQTFDVELLDKKDGDKLTFEALAIIDGENSEFGTPTLKNKVEAEVLKGDYQGTKVVSIRFKAKKRVDIKRGHRQRYSKVKVLKIA
jgi:large subunit ribosomal protein L21